MLRIKDTLVDYEITLITDAFGTKANIVLCFLELVQKKGQLFFYFSGHGQENPEAIVCSDTTLTHLEFRDMLTHLDPDANLVAVIDTCFSGNLFDLTYRWANEWVQNAGLNSSLFNASLSNASHGEVTLISSSLAGEPSLEYLTRTTAFGAFTQAYLHAIQDHPTWLVLMEHISHLRQTPVLTSDTQVDVDQPFDL